MGIKNFAAKALRSVAAAVEDRIHDAQAQAFCGKCDRCPYRNITRNPYTAVIFSPPGEGVPTLLAGARPQGHRRQREVPKYYDPSKPKHA